MKYFILSISFFLAIHAVAQSSKSNKPSVIAYYSGDEKRIDAYPVEKLTHIIFSFCHLKGNRLSVDDNGDTLTIRKLVLLKKRNPSLKVLLSLGGWGGCKTCSQVFSTQEGRTEFARSVQQLNQYFKTDGIDLDWEYPVVPGPPGHPYAPEDKQNFTLLIKALRKSLGKKHEISFAAGGFTRFINEAIEWKEVAPLVNNINLMTYDLVHGASTTTGHHTPLYSTPQQIESTDNAIRMLDSIGVPKNKLVIGAAFYGRVFDVEQTGNNGLYQAGKFKTSLPYLRFNKDSLQQQGFTYHWDDTAKAPYLFSADKKQVITLDDEQSIMLKTKYAVQQGLHGIMFWQLGNDKPVNGLLDAIDRALRDDRQAQKISNH